MFNIHAEFHLPSSYQILVKAPDKVVNREQFQCYVVTLTLLRYSRVLRYIKFYDPTSKLSGVMVLTDTQTDRQTRRRTLWL